MENKFEKVLWSVRYVVILAVVLSIIASISLIVIGSWDIIQAIIFYNPLFDPNLAFLCKEQNFHKQVDQDLYP